MKANLLIDDNRKLSDELKALKSEKKNLQDNRKVKKKLKFWPGDL